MKEIEIYTKNVYGVERMYVKDEEVAGIIFRVTGKKTLDDMTKRHLEMLGVTFKEVLPIKK